MEIFVIEHDTRKGGCGELNGDVFKSLEDAIKEVKAFYVDSGDYEDEEEVTEAFEDLKIGDNEWSSEDDHISIYEKTI